MQAKRTPSAERSEEETKAALGGQGPAASAHKRNQRKHKTQGVETPSTEAGDMRSPLSRDAAEAKRRTPRRNQRGGEEPRKGRGPPRRKHKHPNTQESGKASNCTSVGVLV